MESYCRVIDVERLLRRVTDKMIITPVGAVDRPDVYDYEVIDYIWDVDREIDARLGRLYEVPFVKCVMGVYAGFYPPPIKQISQLLSAYEIYVSVFAGNTPNEIPEAVEYWREKAEELLEAVLDKKIDLTVFEQKWAEDSNQPHSPGALPAWNNIPQIFKWKGVRDVGMFGVIDVNSDDFSENS